MTGLEQMTPAGQENTEPVVMPDDEVLYELADLFRVFGDSTRIKILYALHDNELCVQDIGNAVQLSVPMLAEAGSGKSWYQAKG